MAREWIKGRCPMGCGETLFVGSGGYITCSYDKCQKPDAASNLLEHDKVVNLISRGYVRGNTSPGLISIELAKHYAVKDLETA